MKATSFQIGDIVRFTAKFLQCTGMLSGGPKNGKVVGLSDIKDGKGRPYPRVLWCDRSEDDVVIVNPNNIMLAKRPDYSGL